MSSLATILDDADAFFMGRGKLHEAAAHIGGILDAMAGVKIDFLLVGDFPGDGRPKPVAFPAPPVDCVEVDGYRVLPLERLVELELASGMTAPHRGQDLVDVMELIRARDLPRDFADRLDAYVRAEYDRQWELARIREDY